MGLVKKVAFAGESGWNKSTIVNLSERLYGIIESQILIDGLEIKRYVKFIRKKYLYFLFI